MHLRDNNLHTIVTVLLISIASSFSIFAQENTNNHSKYPVLSGPYLGQKPPGMTPELFAPGIVSKEVYFEHSSVYFTPCMDEIFWLSDTTNPRVRRMFNIKQTNNGWTSPLAIDLCEHYSNSNICFSRDGNRIYFSSRRPIVSGEELKDTDIWYVDRVKNNWSEPIAIGPIINTENSEALGTVLKNGTIYYSDYYDIYRSEMINGKYQQSEKLNSTINTDAIEASPFVSPDESYMIFESHRPGGFGGADIYISFKDSEGFRTEPINLGETVNSGGHERSPYISPDGKYLFFWRVTVGSDIYWVDARIIEELRPKEKINWKK